MAGNLEDKLQNLIDRFRALEQDNLEKRQLIEVQTAEITKQEETIAGLRAQIDELDKNRFQIKRLEDERRAIKRKLETALERLAHLEKEL